MVITSEFLVSINKKICVKIGPGLTRLVPYQWVTSMGFFGFSLDHFEVFEKSFPLDDLPPTTLDDPFKIGWIRATP